MAEETEKHPAQWALDLFEPATPDVYYTSPLMYFPAFAGALCGLAINPVYNRAVRRPLYTGIHKTILIPIITGSVGQFIAYCFRAKQARKDAMICHYIRLHPERFPPPENRKYADIFQPWIPNR